MRGHKFFKTWAILAAALLTLTTAGAAHAVAVSFESSTDLSDNFNASGTPPVSQASGVGIGGSGGLTVTGTGDVSFTYKTGSLAFDTAGASLTTSMFLHSIATPGVGGTGTENRVFDLGFENDAAQFMNVTNTHVAARLRSNSDGTASIIFRNSNADTGAGSANFTITASSWYKETFTMTNVDGTGAILLNVAFDLYNSDGTAVVTPNAFTYTQSTSLPALTSDSSVYGTFRNRNASRLYDTLDEFTEATATPEPASAAVFALASLGLLARRRRARG